MSGSEDSTASLFSDGRPRATRLLAFWDEGSSMHTLPAHGSVVIGRSRVCDVRIDHKSISRRHLRVHLGEQVEVEDLDSANGTRVRGRALTPGMREHVAPSETIEAGSVVILLQSGAVDARENTADASAASRETPAPRDEGVVVADESMVRLHHVIALVARGDLPVLVRGESGVGKELVAAALHRRSPRASGPFVSLNCAALPEALLEAELFGHERGAFTGAAHARVGMIESAHGGTLFLDEIGELALSSQAKLLRVLERGEILRVGASTPRRVDVRFVAATHRPLEAMVAQGTFRQDLFFRLEGVSLVVPPLRERPSEIEPLARAFATSACARLGRTDVALSAAALARLQQHPWPGNVRELRHAVERAVLLATGDTVEPEHLALAPPTVAAPPPSMSAPPPPSSTGLHGELQAIERQRILDTLEQCAGNQTRAAQALGISRRMLLNRLDEYGVKRPRKS